MGYQALTVAGAAATAAADGTIGEIAPADHLHLGALRAVDARQVAGGCLEFPAAAALGLHSALQDADVAAMGAAAVAHVLAVDLAPWLALKEG